MTSTSKLFSYKNLSLCIYVGNTSSIDNKTLSDYCSQYGTIVSPLIENEEFCDFQIIEYNNYQQVKRFLHKKNHNVNQVNMDVTFYKNTLIDNDVSNIDRKFFIGPFLHSTNVKTIIDFYKLTDSQLKYNLIKQDGQSYLLIELSNRRFIANIFDRNPLPPGFDQMTISIYRAKHPKYFQTQIISMDNKECQICIQDLNNQITEPMLIDYFHKCAPVIACRIFANGTRKYAVIEFNDENTVKKILDMRRIRLHGKEFILRQANRSLSSLLSLDNSNCGIITSNSSVYTKQVSQTIPFEFNSLISSATPLATNNSFEDSQSGWSSPPRTVHNHCSFPSEQSNRLSTTSCSTSTSITTEQMYKTANTDEDIKPIRKNPTTSHFQQFVEQFEKEVEQIRNELKTKFVNSQTAINREVNLLIDEEQQTFMKLNKYVQENEKHQKSKRKYSQTLSND